MLSKQNNHIVKKPPSCKGDGPKQQTGTPPASDLMYTRLILAVPGTAL